MKQYVVNVYNGGRVIEQKVVYTYSKWDAEIIVRGMTDEIKRLRLALSDIAEGRGMFGVDAGEDVRWAMKYAEDAIAEQWG